MLAEAVLPLSNKLRLAVLVSGGGSTLQNIIDAVESGALQAEITLVVSSRRDALALERAKRHALPHIVLRPRDYSAASSFDHALCAALEVVRADLVVLAGYLTALGSETVSAFSGRIMNIHPSLLPAFGGHGYYGRHVHAAVLHHGCKVSGATVMFVTPEVDAGPIILQEAVPVLDDDTVETLAKRVAEVEKRLYPLAIKLYGAGRLSLKGRRVHIAEEAEHEASAY